MRKWILNLHLYGGLFCFGSLLVLGLSSLEFNHHFGFGNPPPQVSHWDVKVALPTTREPVAAATELRDRLGLMGWPLPWTMNRETNGNFRFDIERPGKSYTVHALAAEGTVRVDERSKGLWRVVASMHAVGDVPGSPLARFWGYYTEVCIWFVVFAAGSGVWLWASSKRERVAGILVLVASAAASLFFVLFVVLWG